MIGEPSHRVSEQLASEHADRYESLRHHIIEHQASAAHDGLAVLVRQGVAGWMEAWNKVPAPPTRPTQQKPIRPWTLPNDTSAEVVRILASMTLGHIQEVHG